MQKKDYEAALAEIAEQDRKEQEAFDAETEAYITRQERETPYREQDALRLDTNFVEFPTLATDDSFDFAELNWNDHHDDTQMYPYCDRISDTLRRRGAEKMPPRDTLNSIEKLLNCQQHREVAQLFILGAYQTAHCQTRRRDRDHRGGM